MTNLINKVKDLLQNGYDSEEISMLLGVDSDEVNDAIDLIEGNEYAY